MIISDENVHLDINLDGEFFGDLTFAEVEDLLGDFKISLKESMEPREVVCVPGGVMYFSCDEDRHPFFIRIYKTLVGSDRWILFMKDDNEGYALYLNPASCKYELAWYMMYLNEPLCKEDELKLRTCYVPEF